MAEEEEEEEPWEYDAEALKHWEQFVKKSKVTQVRLLLSVGTWPDWCKQAAGLARHEPLQYVLAKRSACMSAPVQCLS